MTGLAILIPIALGMGLAEFGVREGWQQSVSISVLKLVAHPLVVWGLAVLLGLLGTVIGLIGAFAALGAADPAEKADLLSAGISEAMNCTAFGLIVAIPSLVLHSYLQAKATELIDNLEAVCAKFVSAVCARG